MTQYKIPENNKTQVTTLPVLMLADHVKVERIQAFLTAFPEVTQANLCSALCIALMRSRSITDFDARKTSLREFGEKFSELLADDAFPRESNLYAILHDTDFLLEHPEIAKVFEYTYRVGNGYTYCRNAPPTMSTSILEKG